MASLIIFLCLPARSQNPPLPPALQVGDTINYQFLENANAIWYQQGTDLSLPISYSLTVNRSIIIDASTKDGYEVTVLTTNIVNNVEAVGQQHIYDTEAGFDSTSLMLRHLQEVVKTSEKLIITLNGMIKAVVTPDTHPRPDSLASFVGLEPLRYSTRSAHGLFPDIPFDSTFSLGYKWTTSDTAYGQRTVTTYLMVSKTPIATTFTFTSSRASEHSNTNTNGQLVIDSRSGMVVERETKNVTLGIHTINKTKLIVNKKTATSETFIKK